MPRNTHTVNYNKFNHAPDFPTRIMIGGEHNDILRGSSFDDYLSGNGGNDTLYGKDGNDTLDGGTGNDALFSGAGANELSGGQGDDCLILDGASGIQGIDGGPGIDTLVVLPSSPDFYIVALDNTAGRQGITESSLNGSTIAGVENVIAYGSVEVEGNQGDNYLEVHGESTAILGFDGDDIISANNAPKSQNFFNANIAPGAGDDIVYVNKSTAIATINDNVSIGFGGGDYIQSSSGDDEYHLGSGRVSVNYHSQDTGNDTITDFTSGKDAIYFYFQITGVEESHGNTIFSTELGTVVVDAIHLVEGQDYIIV